MAMPISPFGSDITYLELVNEIVSRFHVPRAEVVIQFTVPGENGTFWRIKCGPDVRHMILLHVQHIDNILVFSNPMQEPL